MLGGFIVSPNGSSRRHEEGDTVGAGEAESLHEPTDQEVKDLVGFTRRRSRSLASLRTDLAALRVNDAAAYNVLVDKMLARMLLSDYRFALDESVSVDGSEPAV
jgi:hypothetical protein